jgi:hypothetical protein
MRQGKAIRTPCGFLTIAPVPGLGPAAWLAVWASMAGATLVRERGRRA